MQHNSSAKPVGEETWEHRSMEYDADLEKIVVEIVQQNKSHLVGDEISTSPGGVLVDEIATPRPRYEEIASSSYAPLAIREENSPIVDKNLDLDFSSGEMAHFHGEYLASSQELLRQIQSGSATSGDSFGIPEQSTTAPNQKHQYLTKLQFGGIVAACMLAGAAIYACLNPSVLAPLTSPQVATVTPSIAVNNSGQSIQSPNLAANEFTPLNLSTAGTIPVPATLSSPNVSVGTNAAPNTPVAIPYNPITSQAIPPTGSAVPVKLSDSLVKSLLPPNFQSTVKPIGKNRGLGIKP